MARRRWRKKWCRRRSSRARSAALSKLIVQRTKQLRGRGNRCGISAGLRWLRGGTRLGRSMWNKCFGRQHTTIFCTGCGDSPKLPKALRGALRRAGGGAERSAEPRGEVSRRRGTRTVCAAAGARWEDERRLHRLAWSKVALRRILQSSRPTRKSEILPRRHQKVGR